MVRIGKALRRGALVIALAALEWTSLAQPLAPLDALPPALPLPEALPTTTLAPPPAASLQLQPPSFSGVIHGHVYELSTRQGAAGATVTLEAALEPGNRAFRTPGGPRVAPTDPLGEFEFQGVEPGKYTLSASRGIWRQVLSETGSGKPTVEVLGGETVGGTMLEIYSGHSLTVEVRDARTGAGIPGVRVTTPGPAAFLVADASAPLLAGVTDEKGICRLTGVFEQLLSLQVQKRGYSIPRQREHRVPDQRLQVTLSMGDLHPHKLIELVKSAPISGTVRGEDGTPVAGAIISTVTEDGFQVGPQETVAHADNAGRYEIEAPPLTRLQVKAQRPHAHTATLSSVLEVLEDPVQGFDIEIRDGVQIAGRVLTPEGKPAPESTVEAYTDRGSSVMNVSGSAASSLSGPDGRFVLREVPRANVRIAAALAGYAASKVHSVDLRNGAPQEEITLALQKGHFVSGRVKHADGTPAASVQVFANSPTAPALPPIATTDADGAFRLEGLVAGTVDLTASAGSAGSEWKGAVLKDVALDRDDIELILGNGQAPPPRDSVTTGGAFVGHVVDWKTGKPVPEFTVSGLTAAPEPSPDLPGRFTVENFHPSWGLRFEIRAPDYPELDTGYLELDEGAIHQEQTFRLGPGGTITGRVLDSSAAPLSEIPVVLTGLDREHDPRLAGPVKVVKTDKGGRFRLEGVTPGRNRLTIRPARALAELTTTASVDHDSTAELGDLVLSTGASMSGRVVRDAGGTPIAGVRVTLDGDRWGEPDRDTSTDENGSFEFMNLSRGHHIIRVPEYDLQDDFSTTGDESLKREFRIGSTTIRGRILANGVPVRGAFIAIIAPNGQTLSLFAERDGTYEARGVPGGIHTCEVVVIELGGMQESDSSSGPGASAPRQVRGSITVPDTGVLQKDLEVFGGGIVGRVEDSAGNPVPDIDLVARSATLADLPEDPCACISIARSQKDGTFTFGRLLPDLYCVRTRREGQHGITCDVQVTQGGMTEPIIVRLSPAEGSPVTPPPR